MTGRKPTLEVCGLPFTCNVPAKLCTHVLLLFLGAQVLTLERLTTSTVDDSIDPFTNKLLEFEVHQSVESDIGILSFLVGRRRLHSSNTRQRHIEVTAKK